MMRSMIKSDYRRAVMGAYLMRAVFDTGRVWFDPFLPPSVLPNLFVCKYTTFSKRLGLTLDEFLEVAVSHDGFTLPIKDKYIICYNDTDMISEARRRFTLAHELGHYTLRHHLGSEAEEREADCFARNLLAPRLVAIERGIKFEDYPSVFGISRAAAQMCADRQAEDERLAEGLYPMKIRRWDK